MVWDLQLAAFDQECPAVQWGRFPSKSTVQRTVSRCYQPLKTESLEKNYILNDHDWNLDAEEMIAGLLLFRLQWKHSHTPNTKHPMVPIMCQSWVSYGFWGVSRTSTILWPRPCPTVEPQQSPGSNQYPPGKENPTVYLLVVWGLTCICRSYIHLHIILYIYIIIESSLPFIAKTTPGKLA